MNKKQLKPELEYSLLNQMMSVGKVALSELDQRLVDVNLSAAKLWALAWIASMDAPPTLTELADCMDSAKSNITTMTDRLEREGLVRRVADPHDRRVVRVELTPAGREQYEAGTARFLRLNEEISALFGADVQTQFQHVLDTMEQRQNE